MTYPVHLHSRLSVKKFTTDVTWILCLALFVCIMMVAEFDGLLECCRAPGTLEGCCSRVGFIVVMEIVFAAEFLTTDGTFIRLVLAVSHNMDLHLCLGTEWAITFCAFEWLGIRMGIKVYHQGILPTVHLVAYMALWPGFGTVCCICMNL